MDSRERLLRTLRRQPVDRVPISTYELVGWDADSWENRQPAYRGLMDLIREKTDCMYMLGLGGPGPVAPRTVREWDEGPHHFRREVLRTPRGDLTTASRQDAGLNTVWRYERLLKSDEDVACFLSVPFEASEPDLAPFALAEARLAGGRGIPLISLGDPLCIVAELFEFGEFAVRAYTQPEQIDALLEHVAPAVYAHLDGLLAHGVGPLYRICGPEYATPPYLPPALFERFVARYTTPMIERLHAHGAYARLHCHGRIRHVLPIIAEMGANALDPVEAPPSGDIALSEVKRLYGDRLCLMGNIQLRDLETLDAEAMRRLVQETMAAGKPGGGFVIMPTAAPINADLSPVTERNYRLFIETALECGGMP